MGTTRIGAVAAGFSRDVGFDLARIGTLVDHARRDGVQLLVLPLPHRRRRAGVPPQGAPAAG